MKKKRLVIKKTNPFGILILILFALAFVAGIVLLILSLLSRYSNASSAGFDMNQKAGLFTVSNISQQDKPYTSNVAYPFVAHKIQSRFPKNFRYLPSKTRRKMFVSIMLPIAFSVKEKFDAEHRWVLKIKNKIDNKVELTHLETKLLKQKMKKYKTNDINELLKRADSVPVSIIVAQAAIESGWGTSRFTFQYNNLYGLHKKHIKPFSPIVRSFKTLYDATVAYVMNINVSSFYEKFRDARFMMKNKRNPFKLAEYLTMYSVKREQYIALVQKVISSNMLSMYDMCSLSRIATFNLYNNR